LICVAVLGEFVYCEADVIDIVLLVCGDGDDIVRGVAYIDESNDLLFAFSARFLSYNKDSNICSLLRAL